MMAIGSGLVFFAAVGLTPGVVLSVRSFNTDPAHVPGEGKLAAALGGIVANVERHPWRVVVVALVLFGFTSLGIFRLQVATDFTENFRQSSPIVRSFQFLSKRIGAVNTLDVLVDVPNALSADFETTIRQLRSLQVDLEKEDAIVDTLSVVELLDFVRAGKKKEESKQEKQSTGRLLDWLPRLPAIPQRAQLVALDLFQPDLVAGFWNREHHVARIIVQVRHVKGAEEKKRLVETVEAVSREHFPSARTAGIYVLLAYVVQSLLADQWITFALSMAAIFLMLTIAFRSWRLALAALLPNAAPIVMVVGTMGWLGLKVNMATAMLASVSMGLAVDFSIHYLYRFQHELRQGRRFYEALRAAHGSVGLAMVMANLALIAGFLVLVISSLIPTVHFGVLVSVAMLGGLAGNLIVLPLILRLLWHVGSFRECPP
jgi:predicted RND superfamily exporter protein